MTPNVISRMANDPSIFREHLAIDAIGTKLGTVLEDWQDADFRAFDVALLESAGRKPFDPTTTRYAWCERPRGHSKTSDAACSLAWFLLFARGPHVVLVAAADKDQGRLLRDALARLVQFNGWLGSIISVQANDAIGRNNSRLKIVSADVGSSFGELPRLVLLDELSHWPASGEELFGSLFSAAGKQPACAVQVISNAGVIGSWQHSLRERVNNSPAWRFSRLDGPRASWITEQALDQQRQLLLPKQFQRLWLNSWVDSSGDALDDLLISAALEGDRAPLESPERGWCYVAGVDLGLTSDATGLCVLGKNPATRRLRLARIELFKPRPGAPVSIEQIERELLSLHRRFRFAKIFIDDWQSRQLVERLQAARIPIQAITCNLAMYGKMAKSVLSLFGDGLIELYRHPELLRDLRAVSLVESAGSIRLQLPRTSEGHCDAAMALFIAIEAAQACKGHSLNPRLPQAIPFNRLGQPVRNLEAFRQFQLTHQN